MPANSVISDKHNSWLANEVSLKLTVIKPLHAKWIVDLHNTLKDDKEMAINVFRSAGITDENAKGIVEKVENHFKEV